jgi:hypothetical protein
VFRRAAWAALICFIPLVARAQADLRFPFYISPDISEISHPPLPERINVAYFPKDKGLELIDPSRGVPFFHENSEHKMLAWIQGHVFEKNGRIFVFYSFKACRVLDIPSRTYILYAGVFPKLVSLILAVSKGIASLNSTVISADLEPK